MATVPRSAEAERHDPLLAELLARISEYNPNVDAPTIRAAFDYSCDHHRGQRRKSGEEFIHHPVAVATICAELKLDSATIAAALLHDVVEDTQAELDEVQERFGEDVAVLVDGVTKLTRISFASREQAQVENYRKMIVAMARDLRVVLIKLADRLHNMRTIAALGKQKQVETAKETLEIYAPLAHRLGIQSIKWELEDRAFQTLHPRRYAEIEALVNQSRGERERFAEQAGTILNHELGEATIAADISGRAKHLYSIYSKMAQGGKEFNEIYDLTAVRVLVDSVKDCYGAIGIIHSLWKPMPGRFKDYVAMPKVNMYQSLHTTVIGPQGKPLEIQVRTQEMHQTAEYGIAAHWLYKAAHTSGDAHTANEWVAQLADWQGDASDPKEFMDNLRVDLFSDEVYVFTPKGEVKSLPAGSTPLDFAYAVHTDVGHRCVGAKVNGRIVPLHYALQSGEFVEVLTSKQERGPSRDWLNLVKSSRARNKIRQWFTQQAREDLEQKGREALHQALKSNGLPHQKVSASPLLAGIIREMGFKKADDFYVAIGGGKVQVSQIVTKLIGRLKTAEVVSPAHDFMPSRRPQKRPAASSSYGIVVEGTSDPDVLVRMAKCCTPVPGDDVVGYISLGRGITIHRGDCPNVRALKRTPERFTAVRWDDSEAATTSFRVTIALQSWDRPRLLEDVARTFAEHGANIVEYGGHVADQMARNWYTAEVGDVKELRSLLQALRNIDSVFDAYRVTPGG
ncbi:MAG TPA: bifunctional (p)ppGpp synthetase/guanosine-3',5'-bis(diphosphate) 3'-pyrophosphohydrolase [Gaiellales bacterium]|jgi:GTP pyrophosphokinase|nr:bifunctional (p)ppGpp synthetase/guanosine-3',5'-bis(diphosphate) 3'-pyrophosphohydrolase [Gaiellales bacterium]